MPPGVEIEEPVKEGEDEADEEKKAADMEGEEEEKKEFDGDDDDKEGALEGLGMPSGSPEEESGLTTEEWDLRAIEAFKRTCLEQHQEAEMPLEPSDF